MLRAGIMAMRCRRHRPNGYEKVVKMLMDSGADVNAQREDFYSNALQAALSNRHEKVVKMLVDSGADVNAQGGDFYSSALQAASSYGYEKVVKMLIDSGADVNAQGRLYSNALQAPSSNGHEKVVKMLMDKRGGYQCLGAGIIAVRCRRHRAVLELTIALLVVRSGTIGSGDLSSTSRRLVALADGHSGSSCQRRKSSQGR